MLQILKATKSILTCLT